MKHFEDLHPWFPKPEASASIDVAAWVRDRVVVVVPGGGIGAESFLSVVVAIIRCPWISALNRMPLTRGGQ